MKKNPQRHSPIKKKPQRRGRGLALRAPRASDFRHDVIFGALPASQLPTGDFFVSHPLVIKDQGQTNFCPAFASTAVVEDQVSIELDPLFVFAQACKLINEVSTQGLSLGEICDAWIKTGTIEESMAPYKIEDDHSPEFYANWENYSEDLLALAWEFARISYFRVDTGPHDIYGNIIGAMYQNIDEHRSVLTGALWRESWTNAPGGMIPEDYDPSEPGDGHAFKGFGQMIVDGKPRLVVQNSWGEEHGDRGIFYFPQSVVNKEFTFGAYTFKNLAPKKAAFYSQHGLSLDASTCAKIAAVASGIFNSWIKR